jgi:tight adherence protein B
MNQGWVLTCGAAATTALGLLIADLMYGRQQRIRQRIAQAARSAGSTGSAETALFRGWELAGDESDRLLSRCRQFIQQSAVALTISQLAAMSAACGAAAGAFAFLALPFPIIVPVAAAIGLAAPIAFVSYRRAQRIRQFVNQLPEAFDLMQRAVQAGQTVPSAFQQVAAACLPPIAEEFALCSEQQNLGLPHDATLRDLARRVPVVELHIFVIALMIQRHCGGSPVEVLTNMSDLVRKRLRLRNRVRALTGEGRLQALVLTVLPIAAFVWLAVTRPEYIQTLIDRPKLLAAVALLQVVGTVWVRRTVRIDY